MSDDMEALARALWDADWRLHPEPTDPQTFEEEPDAALYKMQAQDFLTSDWLTAHDERVRREERVRLAGEVRRPRAPEVCTDPACTIPRKPGFPQHGPHDFRAGQKTSG